jgi:hypothetical protein
VFCSGSPATADDVTSDEDDDEDDEGDVTSAATVLIIDWLIGGVGPPPSSSAEIKKKLWLFEVLFLNLNLAPLATALGQKCVRMFTLQCARIFSL